MRPADRIFEKTFALAAVAALLLAQPEGTRGARRQQQQVPFTISSVGTPFGVQLKVEGTYTVNETYVEVSAERASVYVSENCPYQGRRLVNALRVGLAASTPSGRWDIESSSLPVPVERVLSPRDEYQLAGLHFQIPRGVGTDLRQRWLVVEVEDIALDLPGDERRRKGYAFAHSRRDIFADHAGAGDAGGKQVEPSPSSLRFFRVAAEPLKARPARRPLIPTHGTLKETSR